MPQVQSDSFKGLLEQQQQEQEHHHHQQHSRPQWSVFNNNNNNNNNLLTIQSHDNHSRVHHHQYNHNSPIQVTSTSSPIAIHSTSSNIRTSGPSIDTVDFKTMQQEDIISSLLQRVQNLQSENGTLKHQLMTSQSTPPTTPMSSKGTNRIVLTQPAKKHQEQHDMNFFQDSSVIPNMRFQTAYPPSSSPPTVITPSPSPPHHQSTSSVQHSPPSPQLENNIVRLVLSGPSCKTPPDRVISSNSSSSSYMDGHSPEPHIRVNSVPFHHHHTQQQHMFNNQQQQPTKSNPFQPTHSFGQSFTSLIGDNLANNITNSNKISSSSAINDSDDNTETIPSNHAKEVKRRSPTGASRSKSKNSPYTVHSFNVNGKRRKSADTSNKLAKSASNATSSKSSSSSSSSTSSSSSSSSSSSTASFQFVQHNNMEIQSWIEEYNISKTRKKRKYTRRKRASVSQDSTPK